MFLSIVPVLILLFSYFRYIEIFPSTLQEAYANVGPPRQRNLGFMAGNRPGPYDRNDRFGGSMNAMGGGGFAAGGYGRGRGGRNVKGGCFIDITRFLWIHELRPPLFMVVFVFL